MQRFVDAWMSFPDLVILIVVVSVLGPGMPQIIGTLGLLLGIGGSRIVRSAVIVGARAHVRARGAVDRRRPPRILWRHILPNVMPPIIVLFTTRVGTVILAESGLSFLGLGVPPPAPTWGGHALGQRPHLHVPGALAGAGAGPVPHPVVYATNVFGDALRDLLDPRMRGTQMNAAIARRTCNEAMTRCTMDDSACIRSQAHLPVLADGCSRRGAGAQPSRAGARPRSRSTAATLNIGNVYVTVSPMSCGHRPTGPGSTTRTPVWSYEQLFAADL